MHRPVRGDHRPGATEGLATPDQPRPPPRTVAIHARTSRLDHLARARSSTTCARWSPSWTSAPAASLAGPCPATRPPPAPHLGRVLDGDGRAAGSVGLAALPRPWR